MTDLLNFSLPLLKDSSGRDREIKQFGLKKVEEVIYQHLFFDKDHRELDKEVLGKIDGSTKGRMSANILYYYGIKGKNANNKAMFRGIFKDISLQEGIEYLEKLIVQEPSRGDIENLKKIITHLKNGIDREEFENDSLYLDEVDEDLNQTLNEETNLFIVDEVKIPAYSDKVRERKCGYGRNPKIAAEAILEANFKCEVDEAHDTFISKKYKKPYVEAHHIVPMKYQYKYPNASLDVHANIVALCPKCHRLIHHAIDSESEASLELLFNRRASRLSNCGIDIDLETLLLMYKG